ncbi:calbindin-like, partial [Convolutriloba macropyga]|uniref:calbindin-like n=1 Tax=Convolutriloba macropyga TaxID=536237 RepID=UPI003F51D2EF
SGFIEVDPKLEGEESEFEKFMYDLVEIVFNEKMDKEATKNVSKAFVTEYNTGEKGKFGMSEMMDILPVEESGLQKLVVECKMSSLDVDKIFQHYDTDNSGYIQEEELELLVRDLIKKKSDSDKDEVVDSEVSDYKAELLTLADKDGDGQISKAELLLLVKMFLR